MLLRGWPREEARHVPGVITSAMRVRGVSNSSASAFASLREVRRAHDLHGIQAPRLRRHKLVAHTVVRFLLQRAWGESAMWRLRRWREALFAA
jgi:hypothetical protein